MREFWKCKNLDEWTKLSDEIIRKRIQEIKRAVGDTVEEIDTLNKENVKSENVMTQKFQ